MYKEQWVLVRKSDGTPHEFVRCAVGRTSQEAEAWVDDMSDDFQVDIETVECQNSSVAQELAKTRIDIFFNTKFLQKGDKSNETS